MIRLIPEHMNNPQNRALGSWIQVFRCSGGRHGYFAISATIASKAFFSITIIPSGVAVRVRVRVRVRLGVRVRITLLHGHHSYIAGAFSI